MVRDLFKEKLEYYAAKFNTKAGIFEHLIGSFIWGYIIINHTEVICAWVLGILSFLDEGILLNYLSYLFFGLVLIPLGLAITFVLTKIYKIFFKNGRII